MVNGFCGKHWHHRNAMAVSPPCAGSRPSGLIASGVINVPPRDVAEIDAELKVVTERIAASGLLPGPASTHVRVRERPARTPAIAAVQG